MDNSLKQNWSTVPGIYCSCNDIDNGGCDAENNILDKAVDSFNSPVHDTGCPAYLTGLMPPEKKNLNLSRVSRKG